MEIDDVKEKILSCLTSVILAVVLAAGVVVQPTVAEAAPPVQTIEAEEDDWIDGQTLFFDIVDRYIKKIYICCKAAPYQAGMSGMEFFSAQPCAGWMCRQKK